METHVGRTESLRKYVDRVEMKWRVEKRSYLFCSADKVDRIRKRILAEHSRNAYKISSRKTSREEDAS